MSLRKTWAALGKRLGALRSDRRGNVATIFAFGAIPAVGLIALGLDYSTELTYKWKIDAACDAASIAGVTGVQNYIKSYTGTGDPTAAAQAAGQALAQAQFNANTGTQLAGVTVTSNISTTLPSISNGTISYQVTASSSIPTAMMRLFNVDSLPVSGASTATAVLPAYVNLFIVIDNSQSMGIGAESADQQIIYNQSLTSSNFSGFSPARSMNSDRASGEGNGCALVCHYDAPSGNYDGAQQDSSTDLTAIVRAAGARLRIDVAKQAIAAALGKIAAGNISIAVFTMSSSLTQVYPAPASGSAWSCYTSALNSTSLTQNGNFAYPSNDITDGLTAINAIDLQNNVLFPNSASVTSQQYSNGGTFITNGFQCLNAQLKTLNISGTSVTPGMGLTKYTPFSFVIFLSDGVQDSAREAQMGSNAPVVDYPYYKDSQPSWTFATLSTCTDNTSCVESTVFDTPQLYIEAMDQTQCSPIKTLGYNIMTLEVQYIIPATSYQGTSGAAINLFPMASDVTGASSSGGASVSSGAVSTNMAACASMPAYAYSANSVADINSAANSLFGSIKQVQAARITN